MKLHYQIIGSGQPLVILHGLFGSLDNWRGLAKQLSTHAQVISVDLRNHGRSPHSAEQTYQLMAADLVELLDELGVDEFDLIGHSVGGKVAMEFSKHYPDYLRKLVVVDIAPRRYDDDHSHIFKRLLAIDLSQYTRRSQVDQAIQTSIPNKAVRQFLLMNLTVEDGQLMWRINLQALFNNYPNLLQSVCENSVIDINSCFIRGGQSKYVLASDRLLIESSFPNSELFTIESAGHWVHAEAPAEFLAKITEFFDYD